MLVLPLTPPPTGAAFLTPLSIIPIGGAISELVAEFIFRDVDGTLIRVQPGYRTDGESGPVLIKDLLIEENNLRQWPAWLHDPLYQAGIGKDYADGVYARALAVLPINRLSDWELSHAVHLFGMKSYQGDQQDLVQKALATSHLVIEKAS